MNDHIPAFSGLEKSKEKHLLSPGSFFEASNIRSDSGIPRTRRGFVHIIHFPSTDQSPATSNYSLLWPTCLPFMPLIANRYANNDNATANDPFSQWQLSNRAFVTYSAFTVRRGALRSFYNGRGGFADCENPSLYDPAGTVDKFKWSVKHFGFN